jgi:hypothetical protein
MASADGADKAIGRDAMFAQRSQVTNASGKRMAMTTGILRALAALSVVGLGVTGESFRVVAQNGGPEVAYVETVSGRVFAFAQGKPTLLDVLDLVGDGTALTLQADSTLRLCHYRLGKRLNLKGPLRASITAAGLTTEDGKPVAASAESCAAPVLSLVQGGIVSRGGVSREVALTTVDVSLRPIIKVVNQSKTPIRQVALWDDLRQNVVVTFEGNTARPKLDADQSYLLVVDQGDGNEAKLTLKASAATRSGPLILTVR